MTILRIITNANGHTVYFKEPIKNFQYIKLVSCSLYNSWINLKENGLITLTYNNDNQGQSHIEIPHGHHTSSIGNGGSSAEILRSIFRSDFALDFLPEFLARIFARIFA